MAELKLENFAKIKNTSLDIKDITVIAGKPGTGKSYIMKILYAINEGFFNVSSKVESTGFQANLLEKKLHSLEKENKYTKKQIKELEKLLEEIKKEQVTLDNLNIKLNESYSGILESIFGSLEQISNNFKVTLKKFMMVNKNGNIEISYDSKSEFFETLFVETPLILEFKSFMNRNEGKTPYHIESLLNVLDKDYSIKDQKQKDFINSFSKLSKEIINGTIESKGDTFTFKRNDEKTFDIVNASSGIKSIGLLQYLVVNNALKKDSVLFWEEPEVHLHPTWQLKMVELFIELMNNGVKIIFSTHSPYMCDYLNALLKKQKLEKKVSFNLLSEDKEIVINTILNEKNWDLLQTELLGPLEEIMWEYV
ncbi:ATP-binding protein [Halarcobacter sp.]|uniref:ATP-binding protein n=1 Tax=Halarcobacter sp. TaxID=2321133 RepID=UPI002AABFBD0|nr:ATP-binding protein [Halarcobacter sp.]